MNYCPWCRKYIGKYAVVPAPTKKPKAKAKKGTR